MNATLSILKGLHFYSMYVLYHIKNVDILENVRQETASHNTPTTATQMSLKVPNISSLCTFA